MGLVSRDFVYSAGAVIVASQHNTNENTLYTLVNGNLNTANLASNANIADTQLASITTAGKVNISALTMSSQATGDMFAASGASTWARIAAAGATTVLHGGTTPAFSAIVTADLPAGTVLQYVTAKSSAEAHGTGIYTIDDNVPANTSGNILSALNLAITPKNSSNILEFSGVIYMSNDTTASSNFVIALHQDSVANALDWCIDGKSGNDIINAVPFYFTIAAGTTSATTFKFYYGGTSASTTTVNGIASARKGGGVLYSVATVKELKA